MARPRATGTNPAEARRIWEGYVAAGGNFIDTSDAHQQGKAERLVGQLIGPDRADFVLVSKYSRTASPTAAPTLNSIRALATTSRH